VKRFLRNSVSILTLLILLNPQAFAGFVSVTGDGEIKVAPTSVDMVLNNLDQSNKQWGFQETKFGAVQVFNIGIDGGLPYSGFVNSHMIFFNRNSGGPLLNATWVFDKAIVGVMSDSGGLLESQSTGLLGHEDVKYPRYSNDTVGLFGGDNSNSNYLTGSFVARGLEGSPIKTSLAAFNSANNDAYFVNGNTLHLKMDVSQPGDWIRVLTFAGSPGAGPVVPEPATLGLLGIGAFLFGSSRLRLKQS